MTFDEYKGKMAALLIAEAFDALRLSQDPNVSAWKIFKMHWRLANVVLRYESVGEIRDLLYDNGFFYHAMLHMKNMDIVFNEVVKDPF